MKSAACAATRPKEKGILFVCSASRARAVVFSSSFSCCALFYFVCYRALWSAAGDAVMIFLFLRCRGGGGRLATEPKKCLVCFIWLRVRLLHVCLCAWVYRKVPGRRRDTNKQNWEIVWQAYSADRTADRAKAAQAQGNPCARAVVSRHIHRLFSAGLALSPPTHRQFPGRLCFLNKEKKRDKAELIR